MKNIILLFFTSIAALFTFSSCTDRLNIVFTVDYEFIPGDGLKEGVDYVPFSSSRSVTIARGVTRMPVRITYNSNVLDPAKDNTLTIKLTGCSDPSLNIGYPGPAANFSKHIVTKR